MQVGPGGQPGRADIPDHLALLYPRAALDLSRECAQMDISSGDAVDVTELDEIAISPSATGSENDSIAGSHHRGSRSSSVIGSLVSSSQPQHGMESGAG